MIEWTEILREQGEITQHLMKACRVLCPVQI